MMKVVYRLVAMSANPTPPRKNLTANSSLYPRNPVQSLVGMVTVAGKDEGAVGEEKLFSVQMRLLNRKKGLSSEKKHYRL